MRHGTTVVIATDDWQPFAHMGARFATVANSGAVSWTTQGDLVASQAALNPVPNHTRQLKRDDLAGSATQLMTQEALSRQQAVRHSPARTSPVRLGAEIRITDITAIDTNYNILVKIEKKKKMEMHLL